MLLQVDLNVRHQYRNRHNRVLELLHSNAKGIPLHEISNTKGRPRPASNLQNNSQQRSRRVLLCISLPVSLYTPRSLLSSIQSTMKSVFTLGVVLLGLSNSIANAAAVHVERMEMARVEARDGLEERQSPAQCLNGGHGPNTRHCWAPGFSESSIALLISCELIEAASATDMYTSWPNTGVTVSYNLRIENTTCNPDGAGSRVCMLINGRTPGPTIVANWGDTIRVTVRNLLQHNGTSIHWHGFRMLNTNIQDGTNGITECALAPGDVKTYQFQATEYGTSWYHSHFSHQVSLTALNVDRHS